MLPDNATLDDFNKLIQSVLHDPNSRIYRYNWDRRIPYGLVVATPTVEESQWLVMFGLNGIMETAFVITRPGYVEQKEMMLLGTIEELVR